MEGILYAIVPLLGGLVMYAIISAAVRSPGKVLRQKFVSLGTLSGKTFAQISAVCGSPSSVSGVQGGTVRQWMATGYHIALLFDENDICKGVTHETSV